LWRGQLPGNTTDSYLQIIKNKPFVIFSITSLATWFIYSLFALLLPLRGEAVLTNGKFVGTIWIITSIIVIITQGFIAKYILHKVNPLTAISVGILFFGGGLFMIGLSYSFKFLTFSAVIFLIGEMLMLPTTDSLTSQLAHTELIGAYFGISSLIAGLGTALGNFIGGQLINAYGITGSMTSWYIFTVASVIAALMILFISKLTIINAEVAEQEIK
jgi:MFS family permease